MAKPQPAPTKLVFDVPKLADQQPTWTFGVFDFGRAEGPDRTWFNPGLIERNGQRVLLARCQVHPTQFQPEGLKVGLNTVMAFTLDPKTNNPVSGVRVKFPQQHLEEQFEDARGVVHDGHVWLSVCNFVITGNTWTGARQILARTNGDWKAEARFDVRYGKNFNGGNEKNWVWFFHDGTPRLIYSATPHTVVEFGQNLEMVQEHQTMTKTGWQYGEIRGGTPPVRIDDRYWTFFHSSQPWVGGKRRYFMGAYAFEAKPPFKLTAISSMPLLIGNHNDYWKPWYPLVVFPCGALFKDGRWFVTMGVNDLKCAWCEFAHRDIEKQMVML